MDLIPLLLLIPSKIHPLIYYYCIQDLENTTTAVTAERNDNKSDISTERLLYASDLIKLQNVSKSDLKRTK